MEHINTNLNMEKTLKYIKKRRISIYIFGYLVTFSLRIAKFEQAVKRDKYYLEYGNQDREILKNNQFIVKSKFKSK